MADEYAGLVKKVQQYCGSSKDVQTAINQIYVDTATLDREVVTTKKISKLVSLIEVLNDTRLDRNLSVVYVASGLDLEFPLLLGHNKIIMVDPELSPKRRKKELIDKVKKFYRLKNESSNEIIINFDYNGLTLPIEISIRPQFYQEYKSEGPIGVLLEYLGPPPQQFYTKYHLIRNLVKGGILYIEGLQHQNPEEFGFKEEIVLEKIKFPGGFMKEGIYSVQHITDKDITRMETLTKKNDEERQRIFDEVGRINKARK